MGYVAPARGRDAQLLRIGLLRRVPDALCRGRGRSSRPDPQRGGAQDASPDLLLARQERRARAGSVAGRSQPDIRRTMNDGSASSTPAKHERIRTAPFFYGWVLVAIAFVTMAVGVNARTAFSLLFPAMLDEFGWDRGLTAGAFSFGFLVSAVVTPFVGRLRYQRRPWLVSELGVAGVGIGLLRGRLG